jgi:hypothetical protein
VLARTALRLRCFRSGEAAARRTDLPSCLVRSARIRYTK